LSVIPGLTRNPVFTREYVLSFTSPPVFPLLAGGARGVWKRLLLLFRPFGGAQGKLRRESRKLKKLDMGMNL